MRAQLTDRGEGGGSPAIVRVNLDVLFAHCGRREDGHDAGQAQRLFLHDLLAIIWRGVGGGRRGGQQQVAEWQG